MGQKLEKLSEKDEESHTTSECSEQTGETEQSETRGRDEIMDQDNCSFATPQSIDGISGSNVSGLATGHAQEHAREHAVTSARTDSQTGQPIRPLCQQQHPFNTRGKWVGGDRESRSVTRTVEESRTVLRPKDTSQTLILKQGSASEAVVCTRTTAMEEKGNGRKSETGCSKLDPDTRSRGLTASGDPTNDEDFVVLERDETWMSSDGENDPFGARIKTENLQSSTKRRVEEDASATYCDDNLSQPSRNNPQGICCENKSRRTSDARLVTAESVEARAGSSPAACLESEMGHRLAEVTGSRCQLKGVSHLEAAHAETTGRGKAEREQNNSSRYLGNMLDDAGCLNAQGEQGGENKECHNSGFDVQKTKVEKSFLNRFADAVSKRAKAGTGSSCTKKEDDGALRRAADSHPPKAKAHRSEIPQRDHPSFSLEQCDAIPSLPLPGNEACDEKIQVANSKRERELVFFSAVVTPPPLTHLLTKKDTTMEKQNDTSVANSQMPNSCDSKDESLPKEKLKVKGPPPPVPKKPKNPLIKLKTAQLMSTDVQRRNKAHPHSEEKAKRRHTFHFNKDFPGNTPTNQDMCLLWDERGTYIAPTNMRRLSADLEPCQHRLLGRMDDQYSDMIDYDYCARMANLSPDRELQNLDMSKRRRSLGRRSSYNSSPPPVAKKPSKPFTSTESLHMPEVMSDVEVQRPRPACSRRREIYPEPLYEKVNAQDSNDNHAYYSYREDETVPGGDWDAGHDSEVGSYKPVSEIVKEANQMQRRPGRVKAEGVKAEVRVAEQGPSVKVSQIKNAFDVPKKSKERPQEVQPPPKKGKDLGLKQQCNVPVRFHHSQATKESLDKPSVNYLPSTKHQTD